jgi:phosphatidylinositol alpha-1,6-mannosyltransferase
MSSSLVFLCFDYPPNDGGIARLCTNSAVALQQEGVGIEVITHRVKTNAEGLARPPVPTLTVPTLRPLRELAAVLQMRARQGVPVLAATWYPEGLVAQLSGVRRVAVLAHGAEFFPPAGVWRRWWWPRLGCRVLDTASAVVANSRYTSTLVRSVAPRARTETVPLAVDETLFSPGDRRGARQRWGLPDSATVLLSVSRICRFKGHDTVLQAIASLSPEQREDLVFIVAGKGDAEQELRNLASDLGVAENVRWLGFVREEQLPSLYRAADLFVLCTREEPGIRAVEGFGLVFLEAQSCGVPAIGTDCGGIPDAVEDGNGGWLVPPGDPEALSGLLRRLVTSPGEIREMGKLARKRVLKGFTWQQYARRLLAALERRGVLTDG